MIVRLFSARRRMAAPPIGAVVHAMGEFVRVGARIVPAWDWLEESGLSVHALIYSNGDVLRGCTDADVAYHAGKSRWADGREGCNLFTLGAEFLVAGDHDYPSLLARMAAPDCYTEEQLEAGAALYAEWAARCGFGPDAIVGHSDVAGDDVRGEDQGKRDPGAGFPWERFRGLIASAPVRAGPLE